MPSSDAGVNASADLVISFPEPPIRLEILHPFDAYAGSQRVASTLIRGLSARGQKISVNLGFGSHGFVSDTGGATRSLAVESPPLRKLLYPFWLLAENIRKLLQLAGGARVWANTVYSLPAVLPFLVAAPDRLYVHVHEVNFPAPFRWLLKFASRRGATLVMVSKHQRQLLGLPARILPNSAGAVPPEVQASGRRLIFVGTSQPMKGFKLFIDIIELFPKEILHPVAYLADTNEPELEQLRRAALAGIEVVHGETDPARIFADGFLTLQLTDPRLWTETYSLVTAESIWHLVPVGAAGTEVVNEVAGNALAFNFTERDPIVIAAAIEEILSSPGLHGALVGNCESRRSDFAESLFIDRALAILAPAACS